jgi:hypothetical protein
VERAGLERRLWFACCEHHVSVVVLRCPVGLGWDLALKSSSCVKKLVRAAGGLRVGVVRAVNCRWCWRAGAFASE